MSKSYIGDGVYVDIEHGQFVLTTENGIETTNTIYLDSEVWAGLQRYVERLKQTAGNEPARKET